MAQEIISFGEWVQARRNQLGLSRAGLAREVGCSPVTIKKIERDERRPSVQIAELLATNLQIPETEQDDFVRRARGEFVPTLISPEEMTLAEAQAPAAEEDAPKHNLPPQTTPFFGREQELADIGRQFTNPDCRLLTILASGGMGKTRLSVEAAGAQLGNFTDGVFFVPLAPVSAEHGADTVNPVAGAVMDALGVSFQGSDPLDQQLLAYLRRKEMFIVLDNFEHLLESAVYVSDILNHAPDITILATSRESLNLQEEWVFALHGLSFPQVGETAKEAAVYGAIELFAQRATQSNAKFDLEAERGAVERVCKLVEGMPLGLELAAAWVRQLSCEEIANEIATEIDFLTTRMRNVPERHRSVRAVFSGSWQRLSAKEQQALQNLSVFRGGFTREAGQVVAGASLRLLSGLVDQSFLSVGENGRYHIHELLRQFAAEKLHASDSAPKLALALHCQYFFAFVAGLENHLVGADGVNAATLIEQDIDNIRSAIRWAIVNQPDHFNRPFATTFSIFLEMRGWFQEGAATFREISSRLALLIETASIPQATILLIQHQAFLCSHLWRLGHLSEAEAILRDGLANLPEGHIDTTWTRASCLIFLGMVTLWAGDIIQANGYLKEAGELYLEADDHFGYATAIIARDQAAQQAGDYEEVQRLLQQVEPIVNQVGSPMLQGYMFSDFGRLATIQGDYAEAERYHKKALAKRSEVGTKTGIVFTLNDLGAAARLQGKFEEAQQYLMESLAIANELEMAHNSQAALWDLGNLAYARGDYDEASHFYKQCNDLAILWNIRGGPGWVALERNNLTEAQRVFLERLRLSLAMRHLRSASETFAGVAYVLARQGNPIRALELLTLILHHRSADFETKEKATRLIEELTAELPAELVAEAEARGRELDLFETAEALLNEETQT